MPHPQAREAGFASPRSERSADTRFAGEVARHAGLGHDRGDAAVSLGPQEPGGVAVNCSVVDSERRQRDVRVASRRRSGLLGGMGSQARLPRNPSDGWAVCSREPSRTVGCCAPTDRSRPLQWTPHCLRRSSASKGSIRMARTNAL